MSGKIKRCGGILGWCDNVMHRKESSEKTSTPCPGARENSESGLTWPGLA